MVAGRAVEAAALSDEVEEEAERAVSPLVPREEVAVAVAGGGGGAAVAGVGEGGDSARLDLPIVARLRTGLGGL